MAKKPSLTRSELKTWLRLISGMSSLTGALDSHLRAESDLSGDDFGILSRLASTPGSAMRMTELAASLTFSASRLSHAVTRLTKLGWVERIATADDGRGVEAHLTPQGEQILQEAWPAHARLIRELVIDRLTKDELAQIETIFGKINQAAIDSRDAL